MNPKPTSAALSSPSNLARAHTSTRNFLRLARVDSERIIGRLRAEGYELAKTHQDTARSGVGRTAGNAPEIDGKVHLVSRRPLRQSDIVNVKIERTDAYDLHGTAIRAAKVQNRSFEDGMVRSIYR